MGDIIDIGKNAHRRQQERSFVRSVEIPSMLISLIDQIDPNGASDEAIDILDTYQADILKGVVAKQALKQAVIRARRLS